MSLGYRLYRLVGPLIGAAANRIMEQRVKDGKERSERLHERFARELRPRPNGKLVWMHGASVGESQILIELGKQLRAIDNDLALLQTCQTLTAAGIISAHEDPFTLQQMAPIDTPQIAERFIQHWRPDLCIFAEGELWPNLIIEAGSLGAKRALVNARMTERSLKGWSAWNSLFRKMLGDFDVILAADDQTADGLSRLLDRKIATRGNLKSSLPPPNDASHEKEQLLTSFIAGRRCLLAASTHEGEEELFLKAASDCDAALILAPRHPKRGGDVEALLKAQNLSYARRSANQIPDKSTRVYLADTIGEMGLWYTLADAVYLGGAHSENVGGHNALEIVKRALPVATGPHGYNFRDVFAQLHADGLLEIKNSVIELREWLKNPPSPNGESLEHLSKSFAAPMTATIDALRPLIEAIGTHS